MDFPTFQNLHSPGLVSVLRRHCEAGTITHKRIAAAADVALSTAYRLTEQGSEHYERLQGLLRGLPEEVVTEILCDLLADTPFRAVRRREADGRVSGLRASLEAASETVTLAKQHEDVDRDGVRTSEEGATIQRTIERLRGILDEIEASNRRQTLRPAG